MITFRKALAAAAFFLTVLFILSHTHAHVGPNDYKVEEAVAAKTNDATEQTNPEIEHEKAPPSPPIDEITLKPGLDNKQASSQQTLGDFSRASIQDKLAYQFPYDAEVKFPAYIWQTWKYTPSSGRFGESFRPAEASWTEKHEGFVHEVVTDDVAVHLMRHLYSGVPEVLEAYDALPLPVLKADFFRYLILLARGGIYSDIDTYALKSAADWIPSSVPQELVGLVVGIEADPDRPDWAKWYSRRIQFCQWTIQSKPGHPVLREIVTAITKETLKRKSAGTLNSADKSVVEFTGPAIWTDSIFNYFNDQRYFDVVASGRNISWQDFTGMTAPKKVGDVIVLPITSFSPGVQQMGAKGYDDPMAFVKHDFEGTWKPENERHVGSS